MSDPGERHSCPVQSFVPPGEAIQDPQIYMLQLTTGMHTMYLLCGAYLPKEDKDCRKEDATLPDSTP